MIPGLPNRYRFSPPTERLRDKCKIRVPVAAFVVFLAGMFAALPTAFALSATDSAEPEFSVSSRQTYAPSQQPKIWISFRQVDHLDFRAYRVKDPIQFFSKLKDAHSFGSEKTELAREKTWLERFHEWKRDLRADIRDFFRSQMQFQTRRQYHSARVQQQKTAADTPRCHFLRPGAAAESRTTGARMAGSVTQNARH